MKVKLTGKLTARRIILEQTGKLKPPIADGVDALAEGLSSITQAIGSSYRSMIQHSVGCSRCACDPLSPPE